MQIFILKKLTFFF